MADSIKFTIGGQIGPSYRGALSQAVAEARTANMRIANIMRSGGGGGGGHGHGGSMRGSLVESIVVGREILEGRSWGRIIGSITLLAQRMGALNFIFKDGARVADVVSEAYAAVAQRANASALAAARKAEASAAAFMADATESEASLDQAVADEAAAIAARAHATAMLEKAEAATVSAAAQGEEAAATGMGFAGMLVWAAAAAVAVAVIYERIWGVKNLLKDLSFDPSKIEIKDEYIPMLKRHISDARNEQKALNDEIRKTAEHYFSAAEAAKRTSDATKEHFEHLRKMNQYSNLSPKEKEKRDLEINAQERAEEIANKITERTNFGIEAKTKIGAAAGIHVNTKEEDERDQNQLNTRAEAAEAFLKGGGFWDQFKKQAAEKLGGASAELIDKTEEGGTDTANAIIKQANQHKDKMAANDELRKRKADLEKEGNTAAAKAVEIGLDLPNLKKVADQKNKDEADELAAKQANEHGRALKINATDWEKAGGAFGGRGMSMLDIGKQQLSELKGIHHEVKNNKKNSRGVNFGDH
jgi:hypothetical protein